MLGTNMVLMDERMEIWGIYDWGKDLAICIKKKCQLRDSHQHGDNNSDSPSVVSPKLMFGMKTNSGYLNQMYPNRTMKGPRIGKKKLTSLKRVLITTLLDKSFSWRIMIIQTNGETCMICSRMRKLEYKVLKEKMKEYNKKDAKFYGNMFAKLNAVDSKKTTPRVVESMPIDSKA